MWLCSHRADSSQLLVNSQFPIVFDAESAVIAERESDNVCLLLEKSRSTEILTPGTAKTSQVSTGKSTACIWRAVVSGNNKTCEISHTFHHLSTSPSRHGYVPLKNTSISVFQGMSCWTWRWEGRMEQNFFSAPTKKICAYVSNGVTRGASASAMTIWVQ